MHGHRNLKLSDKIFEVNEILVSRYFVVSRYADLVLLLLLLLLLLLECGKNACHNGQLAARRWGIDTEFCWKETIRMVHLEGR